MREQAFRSWLNKTRQMSANTCSSRVSNCLRVESFEGDLDAHYCSDRMSSLLKRLECPRAADSTSMASPPTIPIRGNVYNGMATLRAAVKLYLAFCDTEAGIQPPSRVC